MPFATFGGCNFHAGASFCSILETPFPWAGPNHATCHLRWLQPSCRNFIQLHCRDFFFMGRTNPCHLPLEEVVTFIRPLHSSTVAIVS